MAVMLKNKRDLDSLLLSIKSNELFCCNVDFCDAFWVSPISANNITVKADCDLSSLSAIEAFN